MYLETIFLLEVKGGAVRQVDVARELGFSRASVHASVNNLIEHGLLEMDENHLRLSVKGRDLAEKIYERHRTFARFLVHIGVDEDTAQRDACRIEHYVSEQTFQCIKSYCESNFGCNKKN